MTISNKMRKLAVQGNGNATTFNFPFKVIDKDDFYLILTNADGEDTDLIVDSDYSISGVGDDTGVIVTYPKNTEAAKLATGEKLTGYRTTPIEQLKDFSYSGGFSPKVHENSFDKVTAILQEHDEELSRRPVFPITADGYDIETWTTNIETGTQKAQDDAFAARTAARAAQTAAEGAQTAAQGAQTAATNAVNTADTAKNDARTALDKATHAETAANETATLMAVKAAAINAAVATVANKVSRDGSDIDRLPFLEALGISPSGEIDFSDFANTSGSNIDQAAYRLLLGMDDLENSAANTSGSNIDTAAYASMLGAELASTSGSNATVMNYKIGLAPRVVTTLSGVVGNYTGEQILRNSGVADDPENDMYFWDGTQWFKEGV